MSILSDIELAKISSNKSKIVKDLLRHIDALNKELQSANDLIGGNVHPLEVEVASLKAKLNKANDLLSKTCGPKALEDLRKQCKRAEDKTIRAEKLIIKMIDAIKFGSISAQEKSSLIQKANKWLTNQKT